MATVPGQERTTRWVAIGAVVFAALAAVLLFVALQSRDDGGGGSSAGTVDVVVAARSLDANTTLTADMLRMQAIAADSLLSGTYASTDLVVGLPLRYPVQEGEQVTSAKIGASEIKDEKDIAYVLKPGQRGYAVHVDQVSAVGGLLLAGNTVDVVAVFEGDTETDQRAFTVLQNITIVSVAQEAQEPVPAAAASGTDQSDATDQSTAAINGQRPSDIERKPDASSVTLALTPDQVQLLAALQATGKAELSLSLRAVGDNTVVPVPETDLLPFVPR